MPEPKVLIAVEPGVPLPVELDRIRSLAEFTVASTPDEFRAAALNAEVLYQWDFSSSLVRECGPGNLRWIHTNSIGVDAVAVPEVIEAGVVVTNTRGVFEAPIAEFVLAGILAHVKDLRRTMEDQRAQRWGHRVTNVLRGRRALVVGVGGVGRPIVELLRAVGMEVLPVARSRRFEAHGLGEIHGMGELKNLLPTVDDLILATPLTPETRHMIGASELAALAKGAHVVNVGRGPLIDESALIDALRAGQLGAATLDVFEMEPLEPGHPFWVMDNVLVSPHQAGDVIGWQAASVDLFVTNLRHWLEMRPEDMQNIVPASLLSV